MPLTRSQQDVEIDRLAALSPEPDNEAWGDLKFYFSRGDSARHLDLHMDAFESEYGLDFTALRSI